MRWPEPALRAVVFACIPAIAVSFSILPANAHAGVSAFSRLAAGGSLFGIEVRHRLRRHRRLRETERAKPEEPQKSDTDAAKPERPAQPPMPPPKASEPEKPNEASKPPEPMGPPPPPQSWTAPEVEAGRKDCDKRLSGHPIIFERLDPIREGACGLPSPVRLNGFESERAPQLAFNPAPTTSCKMAQALKRWFDEIVQPKAKAYLHATIVRMSTLSSYDCRSGTMTRCSASASTPTGMPWTRRNSSRRKASASLWPTPGARAMSAPISFTISTTAPEDFRHNARTGSQQRA